MVTYYDNDNSIPAFVAQLSALVFFVAAWLLLLKPEVVPGLPFGGGGIKSNLADYAPPIPVNMQQVWMIAQLETELTRREAIPGEETADILAVAANILRRANPLTPAELHGIPSRMDAEKAGDGPLARLHGVFTFVNLVWLLGILGVTVAVGPFVGYYLYKAGLAGAILALAQFYVNTGLVVAVGYAACVLFCATGVHMHTDWGVFVTLTGLALSIPVGAYARWMYATKTTHVQAFLWVAASWAPLAVAHESTLIAFGATAALFSALGFGVQASGLCYEIGFGNAETMQNAATAAVGMLALFTVLRIAKLHQIDAFSLPVQVFGTLVFFISELIVSSQFYRSEASYVSRQVIMSAALVIATATGALLNLQGMFNTGCVFAALYLIEKYVEIHVHLSDHWFTLVLAVSAWLCGGAWWLHAHPEFVVSAVFKGF
jgi:hypothetical protein